MEVLSCSTRFRGEHEAQPGPSRLARAHWMKFRGSTAPGEGPRSRDSRAELASFRREDWLRFVGGIGFVPAAKLGSFRQRPPERPSRAATLSS